MEIPEVSDSDSGEVLRGNKELTVRIETPRIFIYHKFLSIFLSKFSNYQYLLIQFL